MNNCKCNKNDELRIVRGNAFGMRLTVRAIHADGTEVEDFNLAEANAVLNVVHQGTMTEKAFTIINNDVVINFDGLLALGWYGFEMSGLYNGSPWRWYIEQVFCIVESNARANIPAWAAITDETYQIGITTSITSGDIYQSDWDEENPTSPAYILNKPQIYTKAEIDGMMTEVERELDGKQPTIDDLSTIRSGAASGATAYQKPSGGIPSTDLTAELQAALASFITKTVNDLTNYYLKSDTYTKAEVQQLVDAVKQFTYVSVAELPTASADTMNKIYLVPTTNPQQQNVKDEYITISLTAQGTTTYSWEQIGSTTIDLSGYYTALQTDAAISSALSTALADYSTTSAMNTAISTALNNYYTKTETDTMLNGKENTISDLSTIRSGAASGATAYQKPSGGIPSTDLTAELQAALASFITKTVNDLTNYYLKSDTYTKAEVQQLVDAVKQFTYVSVAELPTASADTMNKIYLVPTTNPQQQNVKDEYITISLTDQGTTTYSWEQIGSTAIDLSGYYTSAQTDTAITNALNTALASYSTTLQMNTAISTALNNYYTKTETDTMLNGKENTISDLSTIRSGAAAGATAYQKPSGGIPSTDLTAELQAALASFITKTVNDLTNYYLKSDTYTKAEVQQLVDAVKQFTYVSVAELPTASADTMNKIYLVPTTNPQQQNVKDEYITISLTDQGTTTYSWEQIGSTAIDLSGYYTSAQTDTAITNALNTALASYSTTAQMNAAIAAAILPYYTKTEIDTLLAGKENTISDLSTIRSGAAAGATAYQKPSGGIPSTDLTAELQAALASFITKTVNDLTNYYLKSDTYTKAEVQQLVDAVKQFTYVSVAELPTASADTMNKIYLVPTTNPQQQNVKDEYITISLTAQGTTTYSWEQIGSTTIDLSGYYTALQTDAAISSALSTALADYSTTSAMNTAISTALNNYYTKTETNTELTKKTDKLPMTGAGAATENNFVSIDANGNIKDSGKNASDFQLKVTDCAMLGGGYAVCSTGAATAAKAVSISNFVLMKGGVIGIRFQNGISINGATLNVSSTGDKPIILDGVALQANVIKENSTVSLQYDGTNWQVLSATQGISSDDELLVDLGLPSGLKWATRNLDITQANGFASSPYQYECSFFSWGNTECHNPNSTSSFQYDWGSSNDTEPYASSSGAALTGNVSLGYDAAHINLGGPWRLPTTEEIAELFNTSNTKFVDANGNNIASSTTNKIITMNGIQGIRLKSLANCKTIFFACTGFGNGTNWYYRSTYGLYWTSSLYSSSNASRLSFISGGVDPHSSGPRYFGFPVRAVQ